MDNLIQLHRMMDTLGHAAYRVTYLSVQGKK